ENGRFLILRRAPLYPNSTGRTSFADQGRIECMRIISARKQRRACMNQNMPSRSGGQILVDQLRIHGADTAFCVPGESFLDVLDAFYEMRERMRLIVCRQ